jgi:tetratricopeptide (TPR) repeat protein
MTLAAMSFARFFRLIAAFALTALLHGCAVATLDDNLPYGVLNNEDMALVGEGLPTYLLIIDGMIINWPESDSLLSTGASLYSAYAGLYVTDDERAASLTDKALDYALRAACARDDDFCDARGMAVPELEARLADAGKGDVPVLYTLGSTWVGYIQSHSGDWNAVAELARARLIMERVIELDETHEKGQAHMYMAALHSILPASLGGQPDKAEQHFQRAIELSDGRNLLAKSLYAERYARLVFDRELHDRLLEEVLAAEPEEHGLTLQNIYAQKEARRLLDSADEYF